jgi:hypothetical protein
MSPQRDRKSETTTREKWPQKRPFIDNLFGSVDEQIDLAEARIRRGERPAVVFATMRAAVARIREATYQA